MQANAKKERIKTQLKKIKRLDSCIDKANREIERLTRQKNKITRRINKDIADDIISSNKKYIGKWITAVGLDQWNGAEFLINPIRFICRERLNNSVLVLVEGEILYKYPISQFGGRFKLFRFTYSSDKGPYIPGTLTLSMDGKYLIKIKRVATKKELEENKDIIAKCEKYIAAAHSKGDN
jgi:hypothetical protein